jgi:hypothetical protein
MKSLDGGKSWDKVNGWGEYYGNPKSKLHADIPGVNFFRDLSGDELMLIGTDGGLYISYDWTSEVTNLSLNGLNVSQYYSVYTNRKNPDIVYVGAQDQGLQRCITKQTNDVFNFEQIISGDYGHLESSDSGKTVWSVYPGFAHVYTNFDISNTKRRAWDYTGKDKLWIPPLIADPEDPQAAYTAGGGVNGSNNIWYLKIIGNSINATMLDFNFNADNSGNVVSEIEISPLNKNYFYATTSKGKFFYSANAGKTYSQSAGFDGPDGHYFYGSSIVASEKKLGTVFIAGSGYSNPGVYKTIDNGVSFTPIDSGLPKTLIYGLASTPDDNYLFAATEVGPYVYIAEKKMWYDLSGLNTPDQTYWTVEYIPEIKTVRFGTYGRGIWDFAIDEFVGVDEISTNNVDYKMQIKSSPNPTINKSEITFNMPLTQYGTVRIYDYQGRIIEELYSGDLMEGINKFNWLPANNLPSGNYLCIVSTMGFSSFTKLSLEK